MVIIVALGFMAFMLGLCARDALRSARARMVLRRLRASPPVSRALATVFLVAVPTAFLYSLGGIWQWSWLSALGGEGSLVAGTASPEEPVSHPLLWIAPLLFPALLIVAMPLLVLAEERLFRRGAETDGALRGGARAGLFAASHLLVGVPVAALPGLAFAGAVFAAEYRTAFRIRPSRTHAILASTAFHLTYNYLIAAFLLVGGSLLLIVRIFAGATGG